MYIDNTNSSPSELFRAHSGYLIDSIAPVVTSVTNALHVSGLIPFETYNDMLKTKEESNWMTSIMLINWLKGQLQAQEDPHQYLVDICLVLRNQHQKLKKITNFILQQLG